MRRLIIDTDTGSDDAVALLMALKSQGVVVEAITTVGGNVPVDLGTKNALMTIEVANGQTPPVYVGAAKPMKRDLITACNVHGEDGMGDMDLIHPTRTPQEGHAVDAIIDIVQSNPDEIEIVTIGPVTNVALAIMKAPDVMQHVKRIWTMGTGGFGPGNTTPVAEFNVFVDADSYAVMMNSGIPITVIGFDLCLGDAALDDSDIGKLLESGKDAAEFAVKCNATLLEYNERVIGRRMIDLPDPVAMAVCLWDDIVLEALPCYCYVCTVEQPAYGQVIIYNSEQLEMPHTPAMMPNATVCKKIDAALFKQRLTEVLTS